MGERIFEARLGAPAPMLVGDDVPREGVEEREERTARLVPRHRRESAVEDLAGHVLSLRVRAQPEEGVTVDRVHVVVIQRGKSAPVSRGSATRQILLICRYIAGRGPFVEVF